MRVMRSDQREQGTGRSKGEAAKMAYMSCELHGDHGGNIYKIAEEMAIPEEKIIDFSASINPLGISSHVKDAIRKELDNLVNYPDPSVKMLRHKLSQHHNIDPEALLCGNGSTELIYLIPRALRPKAVLVTSPAFSEYERACTLSQESRVRSQELTKEESFAIKPQEFIDAMRGCDMAFLCNPNNPTGHLLNRNAVLDIAKAAMKAKCYLVVDEAFIDFCPEASVIKDVQEYPSLIVLRSMTKFYALTGLRIGYGIFHSDLTGRINDFKEPWTVNNLAQKAAIAALEDNPYRDATFSLIKAEKEYLEKCFHEAGIKFFPSAANYYLLELDSARMVIAGLRKKGILVRDCSNFNGLDSSYVRVAVKSRKHNKVLIKELSKLCRA